MHVCTCVGVEHAHVCVCVCMSAHVSMNHACVMCSGETGTCVQVRRQLCGVHSPASTGATGDGPRVTRPEERPHMPFNAVVFHLHYEHSECRGRG